MNRNTLISKLPGAYPALITPMLDNGDLNHVGLASNVQKMSELGVTGVLALGSTGEQPHMSEFERALVLEVVRRNLPEHQILLAGTGVPSTRLTIEETKNAALAGADAALVVTPSYYQKGMTGPNLVNHYRAVADASPIPILLYSVPGIIGVTLPATAVAELASHPNIIGMKNSSSDMVLAAQYRMAAGENDFVILAGSAHAAAGSLLARLVDGIILAAATVCPEASIDLYNAVKEGNIERALTAAQTLYAVSEVVGAFGIAGWKAGAEARGYDGGPVRSPLRNLTLDERIRVQEWTTASVSA